MRFILGLALLFSFKGYTHEDFLDNSFEDLVLKEEIEETISFLEADKIYFKEDCLKITSHGIFLTLRNGREIPISNLYSSNAGCFSLINTSNQELLAVPNILLKCPECGVDRFLYCTNPNCPLFQANEERKRQEEVKKQEKKKNKGLA